MKIKNITGYQFTELDQLSSLREAMLRCGNSLSLKGTILLSTEGININVAGTMNAIANFLLFLKSFAVFAEMEFKESFSAEQPFKQFKVKIKKEIITLRQPEVNPIKNRAASLSPQELKTWLDEKRDITLLDTRNDYEIDFGAFSGAEHLGLSNFTEFPKAVKNISRDKPIVMYCTGGIRCEKAALYMLNKGFSHVYQLEGGILNYFANVGGAHYEGACYVFDERVALKPDLSAIEGGCEEKKKNE